MTGARPNFVKVAPILKALGRAKEQGSDVDYKLVYAGTEKDSSLEPTLFEDLQIQRPDIFLGVDCENMNELLGLDDGSSHCDEEARIATGSLGGRHTLV